MPKHDFDQLAKFCTRGVFVRLYVARGVAPASPLPTASPETEHCARGSALLPTHSAASVLSSAGTPPHTPVSEQSVNRARSCVSGVADPVAQDRVRERRPATLRERQHWKRQQPACVSVQNRGWTQPRISCRLLLLNAKLMLCLPALCYGDVAGGASAPEHDRVCDADLQRSSAGRGEECRPARTHRPADGSEQLTCRVASPL